MYSPSLRHSLPDVLLTALAPAIWGSTYLVTTQWLPPDHPYAAAALRTLPAGIALVLLCRRWPGRGQWGRLAILGALNIGVFQALVFLAAYRLPGGLAALLASIQPLLVMVLAWVVERERPARAAALGAMVGVAGMAALLLSPQTAWDGVGMAAAAGSAVSMAFGTYLARRWKSEMPVLAFTGWQLLLGGLLVAPLALIAEPPLPPLSPGNLAGYAYLCLAGALLSYALWFRGLERLSPVAVSSLGLLSPLTAVILGWVLLGEAMTGTAMLGLGMVLAGVLAVQWATAPRRAASS